MITPEMTAAYRTHQDALDANRVPAPLDRRAQLLTDWHVLGTALSLAIAFVGYSMIKNGPYSWAITLLVVAFLCWATAFFAPAIIPHLSRSRRATEDTRIVLLKTLANGLTSSGYVVRSVDYLYETVETDRGVAMLSGIPDEDPHLVIDGIRMDQSASMS